MQPLHAEHPLQAGAAGVGVDQQRRTPCTPGRRERGGQHARTDPARAAEHGHDPARVGAAVEAVGEHLDQPALRLRQLGDVLGAEPHGCAEDLVGQRCGSDDVHAGPAGRSQQCDPLGCVGAHQHQVGGAPCERQRVVDIKHLGRHAGRRGQPQHVVAQDRGAGEQER
ncbi:hypothetical protein D9V37_19730 [Nocardioides mangrovicus]|uniref:Uncharacterized protein n=1 Tax=Nocardioides mangrovicus TaxID=2478913 RepID=A0A3L8P1I2_9ACTN|nr:hypothetical protein D9V37_19730 [Nocardioides mangrovicus]